MSRLDEARERLKEYRYGKGNIDLTNRPLVKNDDGSVSTIRSISFSDGQNEILIPTVINGKIVSNDEAIKNYYNTGEYLGKFNSIDEANDYAQKLHEQQEKLYSSNSRLDEARGRVANYNKMAEELNRLQSGANYPRYQDQVMALQNKAKEDEQKRLENMTPTQKLLSKFYDTNKTNYADSPNVITSVIGRQLGQTPTDKGSLLQAPENMKDNLRRFEDGYQFGDITKTLGENFVDSASAIGSTLAEIPTRVTKGVLSVPENIANAGASLIAGGADLIGQDKFANRLRKQVATGSPFKSIDNALDKINESLNKNSFSGGLLDSATEGIGQTFGQLATSSVLGKLGEMPIKVGKFSMNMPVTALLTGLGSSASETYSRAEQQLNGIQNASWREKVQMALNIAAGGTIEGATEGLFGLMGMGGSSLGDKISGKLMSNAVTSMDKVVMNLFISGGGEAIEEAISYFGNWLWNNGLVNNIGQLDFKQAWNSSDMWNEMLSAFLSSSISQGSTNINQINKLTNNAIQTAEYQKRRTLTNSEKQTIRDQMTNLVIDAKDSLENSVKMYPQSQRMLDLQNVRQNVQSNNKYLRQKYNIEPTSNLTTRQRLALKYNLPNANIQPSTSQNMVQNNIQQQTIQPQNKNQNLALNNSNENQISRISNTQQQNDRATLNDNTNLFDIRDFKEVGNKTINAYQYDNPEVKPFFQQEAKAMLKDLNESIKGERYYSDENGWGGTQRAVIDDIAELLDGDNGVKLSYDDIRKGLNAIIEDTGAENNAKSKRIEFYLDKRLREGYTQLDGLEIPPDEDYLKFLQSMQSNETTVLEDKPLTKPKSSNFPKGYTRLYRGLNDEYNPNYDRSKLDNVNGYESWTDNYDLAKEYGENHYRLQSLERKNKVEPSVETDTNVSTSTLEGSTINNSITPKKENVNTDKTLENKMLEKPITDSEGNKLTKEQQERFKNSKVRDKNGKLKLVYHGSNAKFTIFKRNYNFFTDNKDVAKTYTKNDTLYEGYVNIENPFEFDARGRGFEELEIDNIDFGELNINQLINEYGISTYMQNGKRLVHIDEIVSLIESLNEDGKTSYDGIIINNIDDIGMDNSDAIKGKNELGTDYIVFNSNQFKSIDNKTPTDNPDINLSKKLTQRTNTYIEELLSDKKFINSRIKNSLKNMFVPLKQNTEDFRKLNRSIDSIIDDSTDRIELLTKLNALTPDKISSIINDIANTGIAEREEKVITVKDYIIEEYGETKWNEISSDMQEVLNNLQNKFTRELETVDKNLVKDAKENVTELLKNLNYTEEQIDNFLNGYANEYEKDMYSNLLDEIIYYSRPLEEIEASNYANIKRTNYLIEKRKWDLQHSGKITQEGYHNGVSFADMRKKIEKHLGKDIRLKGFRQRAYGIYNAKIDEIRIKDISEIETAIHELGHRIDFKELKRVKDNAEINSELNELCERAFKNSYDDKPDVKLQEGWAEFVRRFVTNNEATIQEYPNTSEFMMAEMQKNNNLKDVVVSLTDMVEKYIHSNSQTAAQGLLSIGEQTDERKLGTKVIDFYDRFMERWFDDLWYAKKVTKEIAKAGEKKYNNLNPEDNIYNLLRLNKANESRTIDIAKHGFYDDAGVKVVRGLGEVLEPFSKSPKKLAEIRNLLLARRSIDYLAKNLGSGLGITDAMNVIKNTKDRDIINAVEEIEEFANYPFELAMQKGMITSEQYDEIKKWNKFYVPLKRVFDEQVNRSTGGKKNLSKLVQKRTGSQREIIDPLESIIQNTTFMLDKIYQNEVMNTLARHATDNGLNDYYSVIPIPQQLQATVGLDLFKSVLQQQLGTQNVEDFDIDFDVVKNLFSPKLSDDKSKTLTYMDNGTLKAIQFYNDSLYNIFSGNMGKAQNVAEWLKTFDRMTGILRSGATASNVEFAIPNMISDTITAWVYSDNGFIPVVDTIRGIFDYASAEYGWGKENTDNKKLYSYYQQSGSPMSTRVGSYRTEVQDYLKEVIGKYATKVYSDDRKTARQAVKEIIEKAKKLPNGIQDVLSILPELSEQATRFSYFKKSYNKWIKKGYTHKQAQLKAGIETKDSTLDFNRAGTYMRSINRLIAFSNASMQGTYRAIEGIAKAPVKTLSRVGLLAILFLGLKSMLGDDDDKLEEVSDNTKRDNFVLNFGGNIVKVKKPQDFLTKNILNFAETLYDVANGKVDDYNKAWRNLTEEFVNSLSFADIDFDKNISENIGGNITPTSLKPIIESALDHDFYYGNQITPYGTEKMSPEYQYDAYTSKTAIDIGQSRIAKLFGLSPTKIQHLIKGYGAGVGQQILDTMDSVKDAFSDEITLPDKAPSEQFITRRFAVDPNRNSQSVSDVYDLYEKLETKDKDSAINGIPLTLEEQETFDKLAQAKSDFSKINKQLKEIQSSLTMSSSEKREKIDELKALRTDIARYYLGKDLIDNSNKKQIELYEYYPASEEYVYKPKGGVKVKVQYDEEAKTHYAELAKKYYEESLAKEEKTIKYKKMTEEEKAEKRKSLKTSAKNKAKDETSEWVYNKTHKK